MVTATSNLVIQITQKGGKAVGQDFKQLGISMGAVVAAGAAMKEVFDLASEGAQLERLKNTSESVADAFGVSMDQMIRKMREASHNTLTNTDIMTQANTAMLLGITRDADQLAKLFQIAAFQGRAMGVDVSRAMESIVIGIGRASPRWLDNVGIMIDETEIFTEGMSDAAKKEAILNEVLNTGGKLLKDAGGFAKDAASEFEELDVTIQNLSDEFKIFVLGGVVPFVEQANDLIGGYLDAGEAAKILGLEVASSSGAFFKLADGTKVTGEYVLRMKDAFDRANLEDLPGNILPIADGIGAIADNARRAGNTVRTLIDRLENLGDQPTVLGWLSGGFNEEEWMQQQQQAQALEGLQPMENQLEDLID